MKLWFLKMRIQEIVVNGQNANDFSKTGNLLQKTFLLKKELIFWNTASLVESPLSNNGCLTADIFAIHYKCHIFICTWIINFAVIKNHNLSFQDHKTPSNSPNCCSLKCSPQHICLFSLLRRSLAASPTKHNSRQKLNKNLVMSFNLGCLGNKPRPRMWIRSLIQAKNRLHTIPHKRSSSAA